ncbi:TetR/AcrR family transcriptional regulator [Lactococcus insecticola]|uniref:TetR family transcriptional regulator n=1 Tax=Pseudolactococcus insecticola TaxID=2709158 RepID=A0A6A0B611_9LACT|nr:TetR/AcrR family transcriptional regulator [Lactococcus insecticola]GFH39948.1 TetR family transcriptional regulator [Lactococcus insecticola]
MPRKKVISEEMLLDYGFQYLNTHGFDKFTARNVAAEFDISTQPIYGSFTNMENYKRAVLKHVFHYMFDVKLAEKHDEDPLISLAIAFIRFSEENPNLYHGLFVDGFARNHLMFDYSYNNYKKVVADSSTYRNLDEARIDALHIRTWIIVNGMAASSIAGIRSYTDEYLHTIFKEIISFIIDNPNLTPISR